MRIIFRSDGKQQQVKCRKRNKKLKATNCAFIRTSKKLSKELSFGRNLTLLKRKLRRIAILKSVVPAPHHNKIKLLQSRDKTNKTSSSVSSSPATVLTSSSLSPSPQPSSLESITSSSALLQTLPSPTDEYKSWASSTTVSSATEEIDVDLQHQEKFENNDESNNNNSVVIEENVKQERLRLSFERLTAVAALLSTKLTTTLTESAAGASATATGYLSPTNNNNDSLSNGRPKNLSAGRIQSLDNNSRDLSWQNNQQQQQQQQQQLVQPINDGQRRQNQQSSAITPVVLSRSQFGGNFSNNRNTNNNHPNNNNNNVNNLHGIDNISHGVKRPLVQDDPSEPEPTNGNIKRIKVANGYQNVAVLDDRYFFIRKIEGTTFYYCIDAKARKRLMCKVSLDPCTKLIEAHARLNGHPFISQLQKVIRKDNKTYMFFPMSQDDLLSYVRRRKRLPERDARFLFRQMCAIVRTCHHQGIVLRDLKLRKFIFSDGLRKHLKLESLVDAVVLNDPTNDLLKEKRGCPVYVAPEILKSTQTYCGKAADMWSLGVILYTMLIGRYPFSDTEHSALFAKISRGQFALPDIITPKARCIIRCLLRQEPEERITSEDVFYHPWMNVNDATEINLSQTDQCVPTNDFVGRENNNVKKS